MFNKQQVSAIPEELGLSYKWNTPESGAASIIVEGVIEYKFFSNWLIDRRTGEKFHSDTPNKFRYLCQELAKNK